MVEHNIVSGVQQRPVSQAPHNENSGSHGQAMMPEDSWYCGGGGHVNVLISVKLCSVIIFNDCHPLLDQDMTIVLENCAVSQFKQVCTNINLV